MIKGRNNKSKEEYECLYDSLEEIERDISTDGDITLMLKDRHGNDILVGFNLYAETCYDDYMAVWYK